MSASDFPNDSLPTDLAGNKLLTADDLIAASRNSDIVLLQSLAGEPVFTGADVRRVLAASPAWRNETWYKELTAEDRRRYDWLRPHKEDWENHKTNEAKLAAMLGVSSATTGRWRRALKKRGAPDMEWKKRKLSDCTGGVQLCTGTQATQS